LGLSKKSGFEWEEAFDALKNKEMTLEDFAYEHSLQFIKFAYELKEFAKIKKSED
jgi:hypothetical protein